jgi:wobble nucleotide-excising tRNase
LDSNVLFIISTLIKKIILGCKSDNNPIKQVFIFTHNVYFHKEVIFWGSRDKWKKNEAYFGIVKKVNNISKIKLYDNENPILTTLSPMQNGFLVAQKKKKRRFLEIFLKFMYI